MKIRPSPRSRLHRRLASTLCPGPPLLDLVNLLDLVDLLCATSSSLSAAGGSRNVERLSVATMAEGSRRQEYDPLDYFYGRYHVGGLFERNGCHLGYVGEEEMEVYIERSDLSYAEVLNYAQDCIHVHRNYCGGKYRYKLYWLVPGKTLSDGLMFLADDAAIQKMDRAMTNGEFAEIFVEEIEQEESDPRDSSVQDDQKGEEADSALQDDQKGELDDSALQDDQELDDSGLVSIMVAENYSRHKGSKFSLIDVQVIEEGQTVEDVDASVAQVSTHESCFRLADLTETVIAMSGKPAKLQIRRRCDVSSDQNPAPKSEPAKLKVPRKKKTAEPRPIPAMQQVPVQEAHTAPVQKQAELAEEVVTAAEAPPVESDGEDSEYEAIPECSSGEDSEAEQLRKAAREIRRSERARKKGEKSGIILHGNKIVESLPDDDQDVGYDTPYFDSDDDDFSYDEESDGEGGEALIRRESEWPRFDNKAEIPTFQLGMVFRGREQLKKALIKYGIKEHRHLLFTKDESDKVRAHCSAPGCPWVIYASKTSRNKWMQVSTYINEHTCVPRRDNKLVTSAVIAKKYASRIKNNPTWKIEHMIQTVLEDMMTDVTPAQCKRAKKLVMEKMKDSTKGEYSLVFDYQQELLRTNPGSTVAIKLADDVADDVHAFQRFYMCFDACKKGFLAGCRRVIGLDGCFFKGACFGQLLCALGRDANNQIYPVAWAVVEKETYDSWFWFLEKLNRDLRIGPQGEGWVLMSDQQKGLLSAGLHIACTQLSGCTNNAHATKHHGNAHVVRDRNKKRRMQKAQALEAESSKKKPKMDDDAQRKGKFVAETSEKPKKPSGHMPRKPTSITITEQGSKKAMPSQAKSSSMKPFVPPKQAAAVVPQHCVFNLEAYKAAKKSRQGPPV